MHPTHKKLYQQRITDQLSALEQDNALGQSSQALATLDQQSLGRLSRMDALQSQAMAQATQNRRHVLRRGLLTALQRLKDDNFGFCEDCGEDIAPKRLEFNPTVLLCVGCVSG